MINSDFSAPCYAGIFSSDSLPTTLEDPHVVEKAVMRHSGMFNCCGFGKNISRLGSPEIFCLGSPRSPFRPEATDRSLSER
ncbi:hypothetical protein M3Y99_00487000 [Aphelenchoides fujianensis]|nr:hypothetical protein M3Y99_00487000 [Aphelenchoides fujianensis]